MRISDWSSDVCSSDLPSALHALARVVALIFGAVPQRLFESRLVVAKVGKGHRRALGRAHRVAFRLQGRVGPAHQLAIFALPAQPQRKSHEAFGRRPAVELDIDAVRSEEHTSELQSLMRISYAVFCLKKKK